MRAIQDKKKKMSQRHGKDLGRSKAERPQPGAKTEAATGEEMWVPKKVHKAPTWLHLATHLKDEGQHRDEGAGALCQQRQGTHTVHAQWIEAGGGHQPREKQIWVSCPHPSHLLPLTPSHLQELSSHSAHRAASCSPTPKHNGAQQNAWMLD